MNLLRVIVTIAALLASGSATAANTAPETIPGTVKVTAEQLVDLFVTTPNAVLIDSRTEEDFKRGFIEGAISLPDTETTPQTLARHVGNKGTPVVFYCNGIKCGRSAVAARLAAQWGYSRVYWFRGGMVEWQKKQLPVVR